MICDSFSSKMFDLFHYIIQWHDKSEKVMQIFETSIWNFSLESVSRFLTAENEKKLIYFICMLVLG